MTHKEPEEAVDHLALRGVRFLRLSFDVLAGFKTGVVDEHKCERLLLIVRHCCSFTQQQVRVVSSTLVSCSVVPARTN